MKIDETALKNLHISAIAAMAENRVIGAAGTIPWHVPEDFKFFKKTTMGGVLLMGRKTYESIGRPLPGRITVVLSRTMAREQGVGSREQVKFVPENQNLAGTQNQPAPCSLLPTPSLFVIRSLAELAAIAGTRKIFLAGGAELYRQLLPFCDDLFLTEIAFPPNAVPAGDATFPPFENDFALDKILATGTNFTIKYFKRKN